MRIFHTAIREVQFPESPPAERWGPPGLREVPGGAQPCWGPRAGVCGHSRWGREKQKFLPWGDGYLGSQGRTDSRGIWEGAGQNRTGQDGKGAVRSHWIVNQNPFLFLGAGSRNPGLIWMLDRFGVPHCSDRRPVWPGKRRLCRSVQKGTSGMEETHLS